jgi:uncharacterized RDD family membrane protein YckC
MLLLMAYLSEESRKDFSWQFGVMLTVFFISMFIAPVLLPVLAGAFGNKEEISVEQVFRFKDGYYLLARAMRSKDPEKSRRLLKLANGKIVPGADIAVKHEVESVIVARDLIWFFYLDHYEASDGGKIILSRKFKKELLDTPLLAAGPDNVYMISVRDRKLWLSEIDLNGESEPVMLPRPETNSCEIKVAYNQLLYHQNKLWHFTTYNQVLFLQTIENGVGSKWKELGRNELFSFQKGFDEKGIFLLTYTQENPGRKSFFSSGSAENFLVVERLGESALGEQVKYPIKLELQKLAVVSSETGSARIFAESDSFANAQFVNFDLLDNGAGAVDVFLQESRPLDSVWIFFPFMAGYPLLCSLLTAAAAAYLMSKHRVTSLTLPNGESRQFASPARRAMAFMIDVLVLSLPLVCILLVKFSGYNYRGNPVIFFAIVMWAGPAVGLLYFMWLEGVYGKTIGKWLLGIKVMGEDGSPCGVGRAFVRTLLRIVDQLMAYNLVGLALIGYTENWQRLGDMAARTVVVRDKKI